MPQTSWLGTPQPQNISLKTVTSAINLISCELNLTQSMSVSMSYQSIYQPQPKLTLLLFRIEFVLKHWEDFLLQQWPEGEVAGRQSAALIIQISHFLKRSIYSDTVVPYEEKLLKLLLVKKLGLSFMMVWLLSTRAKHKYSHVLELWF